MQSRSSPSLALRAQRYRPLPTCPSTSILALPLRSWPFHTCLSPPIQSNPNPPSRSASVRASPAHSCPLLPLHCIPDHRAAVQPTPDESLAATPVRSRPILCGPFQICQSCRRPCYPPQCHPPLPVLAYPGDCRPLHSPPANPVVAPPLRSPSATVRAANPLRSDPVLSTPCHTCQQSLPMLYPPLLKRDWRDRLRMPDTVSYAERRSQAVAE